MNTIRDDAIDCPRTLVVSSQTFNRVTGPGVLLSNLFGRWPSDRVAAVHNDAVAASDDVCGNFYRLGEAEVRKWGPFASIARAMRPEAPAVDVFGLGNGASAATTGRQTGLAGRIRAALFGDNELPETVTLSPQLEAWIDAFRPDVLYTPLGNNSMMRLVELIRRRWDLPLVVHAMDDWRGHIYAHGLLSGARRRFMRRAYRDAMATATVTLGICDAMCDAYGQEFGREFLAFQNCVDTHAVTPRTSGAFADGGTVRIVYSGSIFPFAQLQSLIEVCAAVAKLNDEGRHLRFDIFAPAFMAEKYRGVLEIHDSVTVSFPTPNREAYLNRLRDNDILVVPVNFDPQSIDFIRLSMPAKIPEYLASGMPILVYGPKSTAQVAYAAECGWGHVVDARGVDGVAAGLARLIDDAELRARLGAAARRTAEANHDMTTEQNRFVALMAAAKHADDRISA